MISLGKAALGCLVLLIACSGNALADRVVTPLAENWKFIRDDAGVYASSDSWENVQLPHTWNAKDGQEGPDAVSDKLETAAAAEQATKSRTGKVTLSDPHLVSGYYRGACWYEHTLEIPAEWKGKKRVFVRFGAAGTVAKTYINKTLLGEHRGGFTAFCYELTDYLKYGEPNELRVQVDNTHREDLPPLSGDFNLDGGLYRGVELIVTDEVCVTPLDYASPGVYITTKSLDPKMATVEVCSMVSNGEEQAKDAKSASPAPNTVTSPITLQVEIRNAEGKPVATASTNPVIPGQETKPVIQTLCISDPHLWNARPDPYLYTVAVTLLRDGKQLDQVIQPLGLRTVTITQKQGFLLNGKPYPVHGVNRHQDLRGKGWAISSEDEENDARLMKEMGVTAVRNAHYPQSENWHRINDREGVLLWDEVSLVNETRNTPEFWANSEQYLREMIHQLYNHPSIAWWGIFNELGNRPMPPSDEGLAHLQSVVRELDPARIVVAASCHPHKSFNLIPGQIGLNAYPGWYDKKSPSALAGMISSFSKEVGKRIAVSEYGAGANIAHHTEGDPVQPENKGSFHPEEWQSFVHEGDWGAMKDNPNLWGSFVWNMFDFACQGRHEGNTPALNDKGLVTHDRKYKKDAFFFYKANWNPAPMVHITSSRATPRSIPTTLIKVYSNCDSVDLELNGKVIGTVKPDKLGICRFASITLTPGKNSITATGHQGATRVSDSCEWILETAATQPVALGN